MKKKLFYCILFFIISFCYSFFISCVYNDEIWNYGFAYNISNGLVPYRDFNLVTTPLYPFLAAIFIKIFGSYLYSFHIFNSLILAFILFIFYLKLGKKFILLFPLVLLNCYPGYNLFSVLLILIILCISDKDYKYQDIILGLLVGLMFLNKQTVGICSFIPLLFYSKSKLKSFIAFLFPILIFLIYLVINDALYEFIDYCFLGLLDFENSNSIYLFLPVVIIISLILFINLIKSRFVNKNLFFLLMFQIITLPIVDDYHFMIGLIPVLYYCLSVKEILDYKLKYYFIISLFICCSWNFYVHSYELGHLYSDKDSYLYGRNIPLFVENTVTNISVYIEDVRDDYDYIYYLGTNAYYVKLNVNYRITKYDMINNGNMGYNGSTNYINEIYEYCNTHSCMFILYKYEFRENNISQTNRKLVNFVKGNYSKYDDIDVFDIYVNHLK